MSSKDTHVRPSGKTEKQQVVKASGIVDVRRNEYKVDFQEIEKQIFVLENLVDDSRFTKFTLTSKYGWKFTVSHSKRDKMFMTTGKIVKFVPDDVKTRDRQNSLLYKVTERIADLVSQQHQIFDEIKEFDEEYDIDPVAELNKKLAIVTSELDSLKSMISTDSTQRKLTK